MSQTQTSAWRKKLVQLTQSRATAEKALETAQEKATATALGGGDVANAAREAQVHRDTLAALDGARREAEHQLEQAEAKEAAGRADTERQKAQAAMRGRVVAAEKVDEAIAKLAEALRAFAAAGELAQRHFNAAGHNPFPHGRLNSPGALAGAFAHHAPDLVAQLGLTRPEPARRAPLAQTARKMAGDEAPTPSNGEQTDE